MTRLIRGALWAYAVANLAACDDNFTPYYRVEGTRVLAIAAEPPELLPGGASRLSALVTGATNFRWSWCPVTLGASAGHACALEERMISTASTAVIAWPRELEAICAASARVAAPQDALRLDCDAERPTIAIRLEVDGDDGPVTALWPLVLGKMGLSHQNPKLEAVWAEGAPLEDGDTLPHGEPLSLRAATTALEPAESLKITWFVSGGELDRTRTASGPGGDLEPLSPNTWTLPDEGSAAALHLVIRDDRGGVGWLSRQLHLNGGAQ